MRFAKRTHHIVSFFHRKVAAVFYSQGDVICVYLFTVVWIPSAVHSHTLVSSSLAAP